MRFHYDPTTPHTPQRRRLIHPVHSHHSPSTPSRPLGLGENHLPYAMNVQANHTVLPCPGWQHAAEDDRGTLALGDCKTFGSVT